MGFFKDFKDDLSEAVNGLTTENGEELTSDNVDDNVMVNTLDDPELARMAEDFRKEVNQDATSTQEPDQAENTSTDQLVHNVEDTVNIENKEDNMTDNTQNEMNMEEQEALHEVMHEAEEDTMVDTIQEDDSDEAEIADETAIITAGLSVSGNLDSVGSIDIFGTVTGDVTCRGKLTVSGSVTGGSKANEIFVNSAEIDGNIEAKGSVKVGQGSVIVGNISATSAVIAGAVKGDIDVHGPVIVDSTAIIVGDIKSKTVQINNGATIDGRCSQCYSDVNLASIFDHKLNK